MRKIAKRKAAEKQGPRLRRIMFGEHGGLDNDSATSHNSLRYDFAPNDMLCQPTRRFESDG